MQLTEINNNWPNDVFNIDINLGNYCNYKCWYCFPGANEGTHKFPAVNLIIQNLSHLIDYYKATTNKKVFDIHFSGGEVTHWKDFPDLLNFLKSNYNCLISMTSNGSKKIAWWKDNAEYFDRIHMSYHHEYADIDQFRDLCDYLYDQKIIVSASVMMDPNAWGKCIDAVEYLKLSKNKWTIRYVEIFDHRIIYTTEQKEILKQHRARKVNPWFFFRNNRYYRSKIVAKDTYGKNHRFEDNGILLYRLNNFFGWECTAGVHWINVSKDGTISATCSQLLYGMDDFYNLYDIDFKKKFNPDISPVICTKNQCMCLMETAMPKRKLYNAKKIISIQEIKDEN
jgi:MoaA/NifB/PqqE/SkfB family radical SAM enzyme